MKTRKLIPVAAIVSALAIAAPALASVTFDPATGSGFVGKGDVQLAHGWNNSALQKNAGGVTFTYSASDTYEAVCTWTTGEGTRGERTHAVTHTKTTSVNSAVQYDARTHKQIDGFNLTGFGATTETGEVPVVDGPCNGNEGHEGVWSSVTQTGSTDGGLYVNYGGSAVALPNTPAL